MKRAQGEDGCHKLISELARDFEHTEKLRCIEILYGLPQCHSRVLNRNTLTLLQRTDTSRPQSEIAQLGNAVE